MAALAALAVMAFCPLQRQVKHYQLDADGRYPEPRSYTSDETLILACLPTLPLNVGELISGSPSTKS